MKKYNMKLIKKLMNDSINKLNKLNKHSMKCPDCKQMFDMRDLSQVFAHENCNGIPINYDTMEQIPHSGAQRIKIPEIHTKDNGNINLN